MTEADWLTCNDPDQMWDAFRGRDLQRKLFLWAAACCDRAGHLLWEPTLRLIEEIINWVKTDPITGLPPAFQFMPIMDMYQAAPQSPARDANRAVTALINGSCSSVARGLATALASERTGLIVSRASQEPPPTEWIAARQAELASQAVLLRDVIGNPFCPITFDPSRRTSTVVGLASAIYAERAFDRLPILADALEEAGCDQPDLLAHCRSDGPHVRGCWAVDLILGKS